MEHENVTARKKKRWVCIEEQGIELYMCDFSQAVCLNEASDNRKKRWMYCGCKCNDNQRLEHRDQVTNNPLGSAG
jgi:hypothetical protein